MRGTRSGSGSTTTLKSSADNKIPTDAFTKAYFSGLTEIRGYSVTPQATAHTLCGPTVTTAPGARIQTHTWAHVCQRRGLDVAWCAVSLSVGGWRPRLPEQRRKDLKEGKKALEKRGNKWDGPQKKNKMEAVRLKPFRMVWWGVEGDHWWLGGEAWWQNRGGGGVENGERENELFVVTLCWENKKGTFTTCSTCSQSKLKHFIALSVLPLQLLVLLFWTKESAKEN